jgi:peptide chain release factor 1
LFARFLSFFLSDLEILCIVEQIGSGDRSERIRTYNFPQGRVTDHRVGITHHSINDVMQGESLDVFIDALLLQQEMDAIASFGSIE